MGEGLTEHQDHMEMGVVFTQRGAAQKCIVVLGHVHGLWTVACRQGDPLVVQIGLVLFLGEFVRLQSIVCHIAPIREGLKEHLLEGFSRIESHHDAVAMAPFPLLARFWPVKTPPEAGGQHHGHVPVVEALETAGRHQPLQHAGGSRPGQACDPQKAGLRGASASLPRLDFSLHQELVDGWVVQQHAVQELVQRAVLGPSSTFGNGRLARQRFWKKQGRSASQRNRQDALPREQRHWP